MTIGPPALKPGWYWRSSAFGALPVSGSGGRLRLLKKVLAFSPSWRSVKKVFPLKLLVPDLVTKRMLTAPWPPLSAPLAAEVTVTSSIASRRG